MVRQARHGPLVWPQRLRIFPTVATSLLAPLLLQHRRHHRRVERGAALRRSPTEPIANGGFFAHPGVRGRLTFTTERAFQRSVVLTAGVVVRRNGRSAPALDQLRPSGPGIDGHFHAAAFRFRPLPKGAIDLGETVTTLFESEQLLGVLHLLHDDRPIGVFDSGVGGLTVLAALERRLPGERFLYLGDTARLPYGTKSPGTIRRYAVQAARLLVDRGVKALVIACNTASSVALGALTDAYAPLPVFGVVQPGADAACRASRTGRIAVIATESEELGVRVRAFLATQEGRRLSLIGLKRFCADRLPLYMVPDVITFLEMLPKTSTDKIDYQQLRRLP